jgi:hypothetical protein
VDTISDLFISKSFCMLGDTLSRCFNCGYCRHQEHGEFHYHVLPSEINPMLSQIPVVVNCFYGDPVLQWQNTCNIISRLSAAKHKGPVIIITKGFIHYALSDLQNFTNLDLHIALSTTGITSDVDKVSWKTFQDNVKYLKWFPKIKFSCEFRPIMYGINDNKEAIENVFRLCADYELAVGYSGLQGDSITQEFWKKSKIDLKPFPGYNFSVKKPVSADCHEMIVNASRYYDVPIFKKTSCLISYVHGLERDYNAHYYRPNEMECDQCLLSSHCFYFKAGNDNEMFLKVDLPFEYRLEYRDSHKCMLHDTCPHPHSDCTKIYGKLIVIDEPITTADVRVIKWLTGYTVAANFTESNFISEKWLNYNENQNYR